jgi:hypothetical protein
MSATFSINNARIANITRNAMQLEIDGRSATLPGELLFPPNVKMGFVIYRGSIKHWDAPHQDQAITAAEVQIMLDAIKAEFAREGNYLEIE